MSDLKYYKDLAAKERVIAMQPKNMIQFRKHMDLAKDFDNWASHAGSQEAHPQGSK